MNLSLTIEPNYGSYLLKSIIEFSYKNDPKEAQKAVYKARELAGSDGTWRYNEGFLLMYTERFDEALKVYEGIIDNSYFNEENTLVEIYKFNEDFLKEHPKMIQSYFILGFLKYKKDLNYPAALEHFDKFIAESVSQPKYLVLRSRAEEYQKELKNLMNL